MKTLVVSHFFRKKNLKTLVVSHFFELAPRAVPTGARVGSLEANVKQKCENVNVKPKCENVRLECATVKLLYENVMPECEAQR